MKGLFFIALACVSISAQAFTYSTGFETAEGWTVGSADGQNGFTAYSGAPAGPNIMDVNPADGNQHLRLDVDSNAGTGTFNGIYGPDWTNELQGMDVITTSVDIFITNYDGANYDVAAEDNTGGVFFDVSFDYQTSILIYDGANTFIDTNIVWFPNEWFNFEIVSDMNAQTHTYFFKGVNIYSHSFFEATTYGNAALFSDNWHQAGEYGDMDNFSVEGVPEPATLTILGAAALVALRRKRTQKK